MLRLIDGYYVNMKLINDNYFTKFHRANFDYKKTKTKKNREDNYRVAEIEKKRKKRLLKYH